MANKFKFRGYIEEQSTWIYGAPVSDNIMYLYDHEHHVSIIQQFTGYYDINNNEIYDGDIIRYTDNDLYKQIGIVQYINGRFVVTGPFGLYNISDRWIQNPVIIGNITEHPSIVEKLNSLIEETEHFIF